MPRIAINGLGRIGKLVFRRLFDIGLGSNLVLINDKHGTPETIANVIAFDTVHGIWQKKIKVGKDQISVGSSKLIIDCSKTEELDELPLKKLDIDFVIDCTGNFNSFEKSSQYLSLGAKKVLVSAPINDDIFLNIVYGINHELYQNQVNIVTSASCTTNCLAPVVKVLNDNIGIHHGSITTIHNITNSQSIMDKPHKDLRRSRSAINSLIPSTTGSAQAISLIFPNLKGKLNGHAVRVPVMNSSLTDCVFEMKKKVSKTEVNCLFQLASETYLKGILGYETKQLVSADFLNNELSSIIDAPSTMVVNDTQLKVYAWYDNEWGYSCRMVDMLKLMIDQYEN